MKRTITAEECGNVGEMLHCLTELLAHAGIVEVRISKKEREIYWDTENKGKVDPKALAALYDHITNYWEELAMEGAIK